MSAPAAYSRRAYPAAGVLTSLPNGMGFSDTSFSPASTAGWPSTGNPFLVTLDYGNSNEERIWCQGITGTTVTIIQRGAAGTTQGTHQPNCSCALSAGPQDFDEANQLVSSVMGGAVGTPVGEVMAIATNGATPTFQWVAPANLAFTPTAQTANYLAQSGNFVGANASGGAFTVTIPVAAGTVVLVKKMDSIPTNAVTIAPASGTIDGLTQLNLYGQYAGYLLVSDGTNVNVAAVIDSPWQTYTPSWTASTTNPTIGNGTIIGAWKQSGTRIDFMMNLQAGSTTTFGTGNYGFTYPFTIKTKFTNVYGAMIGACSTGSAFFMGLVPSSGGSTSSSFYVVNAAGGTQVSSASPGSWNSGASIEVAGSFQSY